MYEEDSSIITEEVKVLVNDLRIGMFVSRLDKSWTESSFLFQGFIIKSQKQIQQLQKECEYVFIDGSKGLKSNKPSLPNEKKEKRKPKQKKKSFFSHLFAKKDEYGRKDTHRLKDIIKQKVDVKQIKPPKKQKSFDKEMDVAKVSHSQATRLIRDFMQSVKEGGTIDMIVAKDTIKLCIDSILRSPDAMLLVTRLKSRHYSVWQHSMNVSVLAISLGRFLNLDNNDLMMLGLAGMLHDIGKLQISKQALLQAKDKKRMIESHTSLGHDILLNTMGELAEIAADVAYCHHEHLDGSGYPQGLKDVHISAYSKMIAIVNRYDNLITDKPMGYGLTHYEAMSELLEYSGKYYDTELVNSFNQCIGTYPVGSIVEMSSGEIAMVVEENEEQRLRPKIMLLTSADKQKCLQKIVDLSEIEFDEDSNQYYSIRGIVKPETYGLKL